MQAIVVERVMHDHVEMHVRLSDWEAALGLLASPAFAESQRGLQKLWQLVPFFEKEVARHFREEENDLYPLIEAEHAVSPAGPPVSTGGGKPTSASCSTATLWAKPTACSSWAPPSSSSSAST